MKFSDLLDGVEVISRGGEADVAGLQYDSRQLRPGECFVAIKGETTDGSRYIEAALKAGAAAIVSDSPLPRELKTPRAQVHHGRRALARMSANFYGHPEEQLSFTGVTGTNGKTTTTYLVESMLGAAKKRSALIGTIQYRIGGSAIPAPHTTPEALELMRFFSQAVADGASEAVMEVSSHALAQERVYGLSFDAAIFTNLTRDHLDYHRDMEDYFRAKAALFAGCGAEPPRVAVLNADDEYGRKLIAEAKHGSEVVTYGAQAGDFHAEQLQLDATGTRFQIVTPHGKVDIFSPLIGRVNVHNILGAAAAAQARGCTLDEIAEGVRNMHHVPGRFQRVDSGQPFWVVVDYAHTDDALRNLTNIARDLIDHARPAESRSAATADSRGVGPRSRSQRGRVITVFGCGGDRDKAKRPLMGHAAGEGSDCVVLTSDNPRSEEPFAIIHDAVAGLRNTRAQFTVEPDRRRAIVLAVQIAREGDIVLIAGKGHENYQITRNGKLPFDDVAVAREALRAAGFTPDFDHALAAGLGKGPP